MKRFAIVGVFADEIDVTWVENGSLLLGEFENAGLGKQVGSGAVRVVGLKSVVVGGSLVVNEPLGWFLPVAVAFAFVFFPPSLDVVAGMNFHDGSGNAATVDWSKLREISRCGGLAATKWLVVIVGCQLNQAIELGNVPRSLSGTLLDVDVGISSDVLLPEVLDSLILETSSQVK